MPQHDPPHPNPKSLPVRHSGYTDYTRTVSKLARRHGISERCHYLHDQHLPTLLDHAAGVVVINSTVGLQALRHGVATKAMGESIYDFAGLCHQGSLDAFWNEAPLAKPDAKLLRRFVDFLKQTNQINGSFYRALDGTRWRTGMVWPMSPPRAPAVQGAQFQPVEALAPSSRCDVVASNDINSHPLRA